MVDGSWTCTPRLPSAAISGETTELKFLPKGKLFPTCARAVMECAAATTSPAAKTRETFLRDRFMKGAGSSRRKEPLIFSEESMSLLMSAATGFMRHYCVLMRRIVNDQGSNRWIKWLPEILNVDFTGSTAFSCPIVFSACKLEPDKRIS